MLGLPPFTVDICGCGEKKRESALMIAASRGLQKCVSILVANSADVNKTNRVRNRFLRFLLYNNH